MLATDRPGSRPVLGSVEELFETATSRVPFAPGDGLSCAPMERVVVGGRRYVAKWLDRRTDWVARATADWGCRPLAMWSSGLLDRLPGCIDHTVVAVAQDPATRTVVLLMRDVGEHLVPEGSAPLPFEAHRRFVDHMAALAAEFLGFEDDLGLCPPSARYSALGPLTGEIEAARGDPSPVPAYLPEGWRRLGDAVPELGERVRALAVEPWPLVAAMDDVPATLVHGDWKAGNLGTTPDGRTILLDWAWPGRGSPCVELAWYLAVNCDRLPESKEATIGAYRAALENAGVATAGWWDRALDLALLGAFVQLGWSKTEDLAELGWWADRVLSVARELA